MSDLFSNLYNGVRQPDVLINQGPLPPANPHAPPVGINGSPDARINATDTLLAGLQPYSYGKADRLSTQTAYLNIPHTTQRIVPQLYLPASTPGQPLIPLSHQVGDGDIAFVMRIAFYKSRSSLEQPFISGRNSFSKFSLMHAVDPIINLATVNYLLAGLHFFIESNAHAGDPEWNRLAHALFDGNLENYKGKDEFYIALDIIQNFITPLGICRGSQQQGGQHQVRTFFACVFASPPPSCICFVQGFIIYQTHFSCIGGRQ